MSYRRVLALCMLLSALLPLALSSLLIITTMSDRARQDALSITERTMRATLSSIERHIDTLHNSMLDVVSYPELVQYTTYSQNHVNTASVFHTADIVKAQLRSFMTASRSGISGLLLYLGDSLFYCYNLGSFHIDTEVLQETMRRAGKPYWHIHYDAPAKHGIYPVTLSCAYLSLTDSSPMGAIVLSINTALIRQMFGPEYWAEGETYILLDEDDRVLMHPDEERMGKIYDVSALPVSGGARAESLSIVPFEGRDSVVYVETIPRTGWRVVYAIPYAHFNAPTRIVAYTALSIALVCAIAAILVALVLAYTMSRPIRRLTAAMRQNACEALANRAPEEGAQELRALAATYNLLMGRVQELLQETERQSAQKRDAEMAALRAQIMPHFLYNTLNAIKCLAADGKTDAVQTASTSLISLLRGSIGSNRAMVLLREELDYVKNYVILQKMRLDLRFTYTVDVPAELLEICVPRFILQPVVENAIIHAFPFPDEDNQINLSALLVDDAEGKRLHIYVRDNGTGISEDMRRSLRTQFSEQADQYRFNKVGLINVNERIRRVCGEDCGIRMQNLPDGFEVMLVLRADR